MMVVWWVVPGSITDVEGCGVDESSVLGDGQWMIRVGRRSTGGLLEICDVHGNLWRD